MSLNFRLFAICVAIWGSTWIAITFQLGKVAPEASVFYRYLLASTLLFGFCRWRGLAVSFPPATHAWIALQGVLMFGISYVLVYYAEQHVVSGLVAVGYSATPLLNALGMRAFFGKSIAPRVLAGSLLGIAGITLVFWPEFAKLQAGGNTALGVLYTALSVVLAAFANMAAHRNNEARIGIWENMAWGMFYGALSALVTCLLLGKPLDFDATPSYALSLLYLAVFGSVIAFACYLTLLRTIGAAQAGYIGVMVPIVALVISAAFEGFEWHALTFVGIAVSVAGNLIILRR